MKLWRIGDPLDYRYAQAGFLGTRTPGRLCPGCTASSEGRARPLIFEWEPGSKVVGDFVWAAISYVAAQATVFEVLSQRFSGFEGGPVHIVEAPKISKRPEKYRKHRIVLPYEGPELIELWVTESVEMDMERSTVEVEKTCSDCGRVFYRIDGVERSTFHFNKENYEYRKFRIPRTPGAGIFIRSGQLNGNDVFKVPGIGWTFCTDRFKRFVNEQQFTNISFWEMGDIIEVQRFVK